MREERDLAEGQRPIAAAHSGCGTLGEDEPVPAAERVTQGGSAIGLDVEGLAGEGIREPRCASGAGGRAAELRCDLLLRALREPDPVQLLFWKLRCLHRSAPSLCRKEYGRPEGMSKIEWDAASGPKAPAQLVGPQGVFLTACDVRGGLTEAPMSEVWTQWEGHVVNGVFPLLRCVGTSDHSGVYLTARPGHEDSPHAALKLVPAIPTLTEAQLSHWNAAADLHHPHLIRLFDTGRCQLGDSQFLFAVMEYAEQNLAQLLAHRALTVDETREMLLPTLDAVAFLHGLQQVQGQLKPSNFLVVGEELKLASDAIRPAGESTASLSMSSVYDPPEAQDGSFSTAGDIWALGVTVVEALTQNPPSWPDERRERVEVPEGIPPVFMATVRRCLSSNPAARPSVADLLAWIRPEQESAAPAAQAQDAAPRSAQPPAPAPRLQELQEPAPQPPYPQRLPEQRSSFPLAVGVVAVLVAGWAALHLFTSHSNSAPAPSSAPASSSAPAPSVAPPPNSAPTPSSTSAASSAAAVPAPSAGTDSSSKAASPDARDGHGDAASPAVLHEEIPNASRSARQTIHGRVRVAVRVTVDSSGNVVESKLEDPGPSRYFARLASEAAKKWKFVAADDRASRRWLLRFVFTQDGATAHAVVVR